MSGDLDLEDVTSEPASENELEEIGTGKEEASDDMIAEPKPVPLDENEVTAAAAAAAAAAKARADAKDPLRPRRKKARRACFACQRAHLTCGDERPCQRCIKRGLADGCQDGVRKKAKYLHDAPPEALGSVLGPGYNQVNNANNNKTHSNRASETRTINISTPTSSSPGLGGFFGHPQQSPSFPNQRFNPQSQMPPPLQDTLAYTNQQSPLSSSAYQSPTDSRTLQGLACSSGVTVADVQAQTGFANPLFDPNNPAMYNFDLEGLNFGNHYGALEFGMLGHMSSGVVDTPMDKSMSQQGNNEGMAYNTGSSFNDLNQFGRMPYDTTILPADFNGNCVNPFGNGNLDMQASQFVPHAYSIAAPTNHASPSTDTHSSPASGNFESPTGTTYANNPAAHTHPRPAKRQDTKSDQMKLGAQSVLGKRSRDPSSIYQDVKEPYSYTMGFHLLIALVVKRFTPAKTLRIAKSLASIRPSFISCTKKLNRQDLIFMEKCFQRTLFEYEDLMVSCSTPALVCRRTGEIAAVNKEFTLLTGWTRDVLLGNLPNHNINTGMEGGGGGNGRAGLSMPMKMIDRGQGRDNGPHPVFLAELFDDDSVIEFYEDYAKLAFGDSRGSATARGRLLTYQTREGNASAGEAGKNSVQVKKEDGMTGARESSGKRKVDYIKGDHDFGIRANVTKIDHENGFSRNLGKDGKIECMYCWTVKRDVFDIPMLIVMNFLPCISDR